MHTIAVDRARPRIRQIAVPDLVGVFRQFYPLEFRAPGIVEQAELDLVALAENSEKLTPRPSQVAPRGLGEPSLTRDFRRRLASYCSLLSGRACHPPQSDAAGGRRTPDNCGSGGKAAEQVPDSDGDQGRRQRLFLDHVAEPRACCCACPAA